MKKYIYLLAFTFGALANAFAQKYVRGVVLEEVASGNYKPIIGAIATWKNTTDGTMTDTSGTFSLKVNEHIEMGHLEPELIISYLGYKSDTILVKDYDKIRVVLAQEGGKELQEVEVTERINSTYINALDPLNTKTMGEKELFKAACCNLSESFETNPSVDVNFSDAVSGAKQIQMLGLSGLYTQLNYENMPGSRGLAGNYGLGYTPGPWIESIQVTKGVGSVANGFESMAGQINVELKKTDVTPKMGEKVFFNVYANSMGRYEGTLNLTQKLSPKWSVATLLHANGLNNKVDMNMDNFLDIPLGYQLNMVNRWKYEHNNWLVQMGIKALRDERLGGQHQNNMSTMPGMYQIALNTERVEGFAKIGYVFPEKKYKSIGLIINAMQHYQNNTWGDSFANNGMLKIYAALQQNVYANLIYQSIINNTNHKYRVGLSMVADGYQEKLNTIAFKRTELVPGLFGEYTWSAVPRLSVILGLRGDYHNLYGPFVTPRVHGKYDLTEYSSIRFSAGRGQRTPNLVTDNFSYFISSRSLVINNYNYQAIDNQTLYNNSNFATILKPEVSWNYGLSFTQDFKLDYRKGSFTVDYYRTDFQNQWVLDLDKNTQEINVYYLDGKSFSNSIQTELNYELIKRLDIRLAYRYYDVKTTYHGMLMERPFISKHRAFANLAYETRSKWRFDFTLNWNGAKRLPNTSTNPAEYQFPSYSPDYFVINAQVAKSFGNPMETWWDLYAGVENLGDFRQQNLIIAPNHTHSPYFDASLVWGPIIGRMFYAGVRYKIK